MTTQKQSKTVTDLNAQQIIESNQVVLIDCWAPWCGPCGQIAPIIDELAEKYAKKASIGKLNIDENPCFIQNHAIQSIPTLLFFKNGKKVDQLTGLQSIQVLTKKLDELIPH